MMKKHGLRRFFSLLLAVFMVCTLLPTAALAEDTTGADETQSKTVVVDEKKPEPPAQEQPKGENPPAPEEPKQKEVQQPEGETPEEPKQKDGKQPEGETPEETKQDGGKQPEGEDPAKVETPANENTPAAPTRVSKSPAVDISLKDSIPITVYVKDARGGPYRVGSGTAKKFGLGLLSVYLYTMPALTDFVSDNTFNSLSKINGDWRADMGWTPAGVGDNRSWPLGTTSGYIIYYVDRYTPKDNTTDADWLHNFKLTYNGNGEGATNVPAEQVYRTNKSNETTHNFTIPTTIPTRSGYNFNGWSTTADGSVAHQPGGGITVTGSTTLYAVWEKVNAPSKSDVVATGIQVKLDCTTEGVEHSDETFALTEAAITKIGDPVQGEHGYTCDVTISSASYVPQFNEEKGKVAHTAVKNEETISLIYADGKWNALAVDTGSPCVFFNVRCDIYTVTYTDGNGGTWFTDEVHSNLKIGDTTPPYNNNAAPTHDGYTFLGWSPKVAETVTESATYTALWESKAERAIKDLLKNITVKCVSGVGGHDAKTYDTSVGGYNALTTENTDGTFTSNITVWAQQYVDQYNKDNKDTNKNHVLVHNEDTTKAVTVKLDKDYNPVDVAIDKPLITFEVKCKDEVVPPEKPTLEQLPEISVTLHCGTTSAHQDSTWSPLLENTYEISKPALKDDVYTCTLTVKAETYVKEFSGIMMGVGKHELDDDATKDITLTWDGQKWTAETSSVTFKVKCSLYTVIYTDGVKNKVIFKDELHKDLAYGSDTPKFTGGTPKREGYKFVGWEPGVADTVTENVTYIAQWEELYTVTYTDGAKGKAFKDQVYSDREAGTDTPKFDGTPKRSGYTFTGWSPKVTDTVTKDVTYTATWKANSGKDYVPKTGDGQIVMILGSVLLFSFCGATAVCLNDRKRKQG